MEPRELPIQKVVCINEVMSNPLKRHIQERLQTSVYDYYHSVELGTMSIVYPCTSGDGYHIHETCFYPEIVAFNSSEVIHETGHLGELVLTTLAAEAMPLLRYRTGQAVMWLEESCACGRVTLHITTPFV